MRTSHVGSFPLEFSAENVARVARDMARVPVDVPPYPQLRDFVEIFAEPLVRSGAVQVTGGKLVLRDPGSISEAKRAVRIEEAEVFAAEARRLGFKSARAPVTGPFTLASKIYAEPSGSRLEDTLLAKKEAVMALAAYVNAALKYMASLGYDVLFIDEPVLGVIVGSRRLLFGYTEEEVVAVIEGAFRGVVGTHGIHVCGRISPRLFRLLSRSGSLNVLNFEFHDTPENLASISREPLEEGGKLLAPGVASSKRPTVETVEEVAGLLMKVGEAVGWRIDLVSADCGFGGLAARSGSREEAYAIALAKLANIRAAVEKVARRARL